MRNTVRILGIDIDNIDVDEAGKITKNLIENSNKSCKVVVAPNTEFIMMAQKDKEFYDILKGADLATPDSVGVMIGGKMQKKPFKQRIPGQMYFRKINPYPDILAHRLLLNQVCEECLRPQRKASELRGTHSL